MRIHVFWKCTYNWYTRLDKRFLYCVGPLILVLQTTNGVDATLWMFWPHWQCNKGLLDSSLGTASHVSTLCLPNVTTRDQICQALPCVFAYSKRSKYWRWECSGYQAKCDGLNQENSLGHQTNEYNLRRSNQGKPASEWNSEFAIKVLTVLTNDHHFCELYFSGAVQAGCPQSHCQ